MTENALQRQFRADTTTLLLDGRAVDFFHEGTSGSTRFHVDHFAVDARPHDGGLKVSFGIRAGGSLTGGGRIVVPATRMAEFEAFVAEAIAARTPG